MSPTLPDPPTRRDMLAMSTLALSWSLSPRREDELWRQRIVRVTGFVHSAPRPKFVGKNSHLDDHGDRTRDDVLVLTTDAGVEGFGSGRLDLESARRLLGARVSALWKDGVGSNGLLGRADHALFDLVGKIRGVPSWKLIGDAGPAEVSVYDGSIYFNDLLPEHAGRGVARLLEEVDGGMERGFRGFKIKVGRGFKWMRGEEGFARDIEVVRSIRKHVGPEVRIMVDANNGFVPEDAKRRLDRVGDCDLAFVEEMFPEEVAADRDLRAHVRSKGWKTLVADGESASTPGHFDPYLESGTLDVLQPDIRAFGLSLQWSLAERMTQRAPGTWLAPHNWGSYLGFPMQAMLGRALPNVLTTEVDWSESDLFDASAFVWKDGKVRVPDVPGCGLTMRKDVFERRYARDSWTVALPA